MSKIGNHYFTIYYIYYKKKLEMIEFTYDFYLYKFDLLEI